MYTNNKDRGSVNGGRGGYNSDGGRGGGGYVSDGGRGGGGGGGGRISMMSKSQLTLNREDSSIQQLCDLHVYKVPPDLWRDSFNNILNNVVTETVSVGIIRVPMELRLNDVREELVQQLDDVIPRDYVFLRSVGRSLTRLRGKQEYQLKAKHFLPPVAYAPELYILEATQELRDAISERMSQSPPMSRRTSPTHTHRGYPHSYRNGYSDKGRDNHRHDNDSGVAGLTPEDEYNRKTREDYDDMLRKSRDMQHRLEAEQRSQEEEAEAERRRRLGEVEAGNDLDRRRWEADQEERRRQAELDRRKQDEDEEERRRREEQEKRLEDERRRKEGEDDQFRKEEEERRKREEEERRREMEERDRLDRDKFENRLGSTPPRGASRESDKDTEAEQRRMRDEKNQLLRELEEAKSNRQDLEKEREDLVKKAKSMQHKTTNRRNEARDMWKKKYFEEKKKTAPLEDSSTKLRDDLEALHKRLMNTLQAPSNDKNVKVLEAKPSTKANYVILCTKLQHEIEDLRRRVETAKMKLTAEMKLRTQAQTEMKAVRSEAMQNRLMIKTARKQGGASSVAVK